MIVGAGTTTVDSGFMNALKQEFGGELSIVAGSTAELLRLAEQGVVDVVIVHDEAQELKFMANHPGAVRAHAFSSEFLLVGPPEEAVAIAASGAAEAFADIATRRKPFVTRDDGSGTHSRELLIWSAAGVRPSGAWYTATGQGMGLTLQVADQTGAFTLTEEGAFISAEDTLDLVAVQLPAEPLLENSYSVILLTGQGSAFFNWLVAESGAAGVRAANQAVFGSEVYLPATRGR